VWDGNEKKSEDCETVEEAFTVNLITTRLYKLKPSCFLDVQATVADYHNV
jgi:hypothetical protein